MNAPTYEEGEVKFAHHIDTYLPPLYELQPFKPKRKGATATTYFYSEDGHAFLVKELNLGVDMTDERFIYILKDHERAVKYLALYITQHILYSRRR